MEGLVKPIQDLIASKNLDLAISEFKKLDLQPLVKYPSEEKFAAKITREIEL